jgi:hypothetical protein
MGMELGRVATLRSTLYIMQQEYKITNISPEMKQNTNFDLGATKLVFSGWFISL